MAEQASNGARASRPATACELTDRGTAAGQHHAAADLALFGGPAALHFHRYTPTASLGRFEQAAGALRTDYCREQAIAIVRRPTGGGALYLDEGQLCWSLALPAEPFAGRLLAELAAEHGRAVTAALNRLGVGARFKAPNDIELEGRKLAVFFLTREADRLLFQGSLLQRVAVETLLKVLRVPMEKLSAEGIQSARQRLAALEELPGAPDGAALKGALVAAFAESYGLAYTESVPLRQPRPDLSVVTDDRHEGDYAFLKTPGGVLYAWVEAEGGHIASLHLAGSVQCAPPALFDELAQTMAGAPLTEWEARLCRHLETAQADLLAFTAEDLVRVLALALARGEQCRVFGFSRAQANTLMVHGAPEQAATDILDNATVMLVPYCAKPPDCGWRHRDGCPECGKCEVGDAYRLARERGMRVVTITQFEHLWETLQEMRADGVPAYVGMCCQNFYLKRQYAFTEAGIPAVLTDISGANCYDLQEEDLAYAGRFRAEARLDGEMVEKVMRLVPPVGKGIQRRGRKGAEDAEENG